MEAGMKRFIFGLLLGFIIAAPVMIIAAQVEEAIHLEQSQATNLPGRGWASPHIQRWHDDEKRATCYALRTGHGSAISCLWDRP